jgi:hypothetical protein
MHFMFVFLRFFAARRAVLSAIVSGTRDEEGLQLGSRLVVSDNNARRCDVRERDFSLPFPWRGAATPLVISLRSLAGGESQSWQSAFLVDSVSWH